LLDVTDGYFVTVRFDAQFGEPRQRAREAFRRDADAAGDDSLPVRQGHGRRAARLRDVAVRTPLLSSDAIDRSVGGRILVKAEMLQRTGSFKLRGTYNRVAAIEPTLRSHGVVAYSSGNHAQGVAAAAGRLGVPATIVMPADAPTAKLEGTRALGAEVVLYDRETGDREAIAAEIAADRGATLIPPFDDPHVIAGQGTVGLEIADQAGALGMRPDAVLVPCSGGGLVSGIATVMSRRCPGCVKARTLFRIPVQSLRGI